MNVFTSILTKIFSGASTLLDLALSSALAADWPIIGSIGTGIYQAMASLMLGIDSIGVSACHNMAFDICDTTFVDEVKNIILLKSSYANEFNLFKVIDNLLSVIIPIGVSLAVIFFLVSILSDATKDNSTLEHYIKEMIKLVVVITAISLCGDIAGACLKFANYTYEQVEEVTEDNISNPYVDSAVTAMGLIYGDGTYRIPQIISGETDHFLEYLDENLGGEDDDEDISDEYNNFWIKYFNGEYNINTSNLSSDQIKTISNLKEYADSGWLSFWMSDETKSRIDSLSDKAGLSNKSQLNKINNMFSLEALALAYLETHIDSTLGVNVKNYKIKDKGGNDKSLKDFKTDLGLSNNYNGLDAEEYIDFCTDLVLVTKDTAKGLSAYVDMGTAKGLIASNGYFMLMIKLLIPWIISLATTIVIYFVAMQRLISIAWRIIFMPIGLANAFDGPVLSTAGFRYIKAFLSVCLSGVLLIVILYIGNKLLPSVTTMVASPVIGIICMKLAMVGAALGSENKIKEVLGG